MVRSTASATDSVPSTSRIGGPHGPSRNSNHKDQSRIAKIATLAVTIKRRGATSCAGWAVIGTFGRDEDVVISHSNKSTVSILSILPAVYKEHKSIASLAQNEYNYYKFRKCTYIIKARRGKGSFLCK